MAIVVGNLALLLEPHSPRISLPDRKNRLATIDLVSTLPKKLRDSILLINTNTSPSICPSLPHRTILDFETIDNRNHRTTGGGGRHKPSKANAFDFDASNGLGSDTDTDNGNGEDDDFDRNNDWEQQMRKRVKEIEEMKELERQAEELQSQMAAQGLESEEVTEEEKKNRVRRELEKDVWQPGSLKFDSGLNKIPAW